jgi:hypothetical protein
VTPAARAMMQTMKTTRPTRPSSVSTGLG